MHIGWRHETGYVEIWRQSCNVLWVKFFWLCSKCNGAIPIKIGTLVEDIKCSVQKNIFLESQFFHIYMQFFWTLHFISSLSVPIFMGIAPVHFERKSTQITPNLFFPWFFVPFVIFMIFHQFLAQIGPEHYRFSSKSAQKLSSRARDSFSVSRRSWMSNRCIESLGNIPRNT